VNEKNPTPVNFMYLNSDWERAQQEEKQRLENIVEILNLLLILV
jgi:hypothetical protein